jgi:NADH-quinone oxidoreductase subunit L
MSPEMWWLLLLVPLGTAGLITLVTHPWRGVSAVLSVLSAAVCFGVWAWGFAGSMHAPAMVPAPWPWLEAGSLKVSIGLLMDDQARVMLGVVTGVGLLIHVFSLAYMKGDKGYSRFFASLSLFMFSMTGIVVADNLVMTFIFWELVGLSSYLLIGFWFEKPSASAAAVKAFVVNRIGDFGFMLGIALVWTHLGALSYGDLKSAVVAGQAAALPAGVVTLMALGLFCGAMGKSAQMPLHVWLPDAMEGPTPVSALIHAATMVAAGVYFLARVFFLIELSHTALETIAWVGGVTALFAALVATQQTDIKRVLAYSTLSQLGYMVMAVGLMAPGEGMFHLTTHAFFKALLFLGAGSVIHGMHHEQEMWRMGGLAKRMPVTFVTFLIGMLALAGCPGLSGFFSKESVLAAAFAHHSVLFAGAVLTAFLTAFYMTRLVVVVFFGAERSDEARHAHESPFVMTLPLIILAGLSVVGGYGFFGLPHLLGVHGHEGGGAMVVMGASIAAFVLGIGTGFVMYNGRSADPVNVPLLRNKLYLDEAYDLMFVKLNDALAALWDVVDRWVIRGALVGGTSVVARAVGQGVRFAQGGNLQGYAFLFALGVVGILYWLVGRVQP